MGRMYDIFLSHAWRFHEDWTRFSEVLDRADNFSWRNFSLPWYDPAFDPRSELGRRMVMQSLEAQVSPAHLVVVLNSVYETNSARAWVESEIELAKKHGIPIVGVPDFGKTELSEQVASFCTATLPWDWTKAVEAIKAHARSA